MISVWFTRKNKNRDALLAAREMINQELFVRSANECGFQVAQLFEEHTTETGFKMDIPADRLEVLLNKLLELGIESVAVTYQTNDDKCKIEQADPRGAFKRANENPFIERAA